jgi:hypothetical protein
MKSLKITIAFILFILMFISSMTLSFAKSPIHKKYECSKIGVQKIKKHKFTKSEVNYFKNHKKKVVYSCPKFRTNFSKYNS